LNTHIDYKVVDHIAIIAFNRPEALNAFNFAMLNELSQIVEKIRFNRDIRVVIFTGNGEKSFSTGADLKERKTLSETEVREFLYKIRSTFQQIAELPQPTIAAINGYAFGGGLELALACDIRIASENAVMGLTETSLAIIPGAGGTQRLPRIIGEAKAKELIFTARRLNAEEALNYSIISRITERDHLLTICQNLASEIAKNGPIAVQQAKFAINHGMNVDLRTGLEIEHKAYEITIPTEDRMEALQAFSEKRKPIFKGK